MKTSKILIFGWLSLWLFSTCKPSECLFVTGKIKKEKRTIGFFNKLLVYDNINVELIEEDSLYVEAGENLLPLLQTQLQDDSTLVLRNNAQCNWLRRYDTPIKIYVGAKNLNFIRWESYGNLESKRPISVTYLHIEALGVNTLVNLNLQAIGIFVFANIGTEFKLSGETSELGVFMMGYSRTDALHLKAQQVAIRQESSNHIWVEAIQKISGSINGLGNVFYRSLPTTEQNIISHSSGRAIALP